MGRLDAKSNPWVLDESEFTKRNADDKSLRIKNDNQNQKWTKIQRAAGPLQLT